MLFISILVSLAVFFILSFYYKKNGRLSPPIKIKKLPIPLKVNGIIILGLVIISIISMPGVVDEDGFRIVEYTLNDPSVHLVPLLSSPNPTANVIRIVERFEHYSLSGKNENGYVQVKMVKDNAIGWLPENLFKLNRKLAMLKFGAKTTIRDFYITLKHWSSIGPIILGFLAAALYFLILEYKMATLLSRYNDIFGFFLAAIITFGAQITVREIEPFSQIVARHELIFARGCNTVRYLLPVYISIGIVILVFNKKANKISELKDFLLGLFTFFAFYLLWGYNAGWWNEI